MESADLILDLPVELACEVLGKWLELRDLPRVDSAFCQVLKRKKLLESIFQSPLLRCKMVNQGRLAEVVSLRPEVCMKWILARSIRADFLTFMNFDDVPSALEYLQQVGPWVEGICFVECAPEKFVFQALQLCTNLRTFAHACECHISEELIAKVSECTKLERLCLASYNVESSESDNEDARGGSDSDFWSRVVELPLSARLKIQKVDLMCGKNTETTILKMCVPKCVEKLFVSHWDAVHDWSCFTNLHTLSMQKFPQDLSSLQTVFPRCPWIRTLDISEWKAISDEEFTVVVRSLRQIRVLNIQGLCSLTDTALQRVAELHNHCLESLFMKQCSRFTAAGANNLLSRCTSLRKISCLHTTGLDYSLMRNITTLDTDFTWYKEHTVVWRVMQQNCCSLQYLYISCPLDREAVAEDLQSIVNTAEVLRSLRCVHLTDIMHESNREQLRSICGLTRPGVRLVEEEFEAWLEFFDLPFLNVSAPQNPFLHDLSLAAAV